MTETETKITHYINVDSIEQERALCQKEIIFQYDDRKIDEKRLALKLHDLRLHSDTAKDMIDQMRVLSDNI